MLKAYIKDDFKNLTEYRRWIEMKMKNLSHNNRPHLRRFEKETIENRISARPAWFGEGTTFRELQAGITQYKNPELIDKIYAQIVDKISINLTNKLQAKKVKYNPIGLGVFSFDRAAMGMFKLKEYYSHSLQRTVDKAEVINSANGYILISDKSKVTERWEERPNGSPKVRTTNKNVFAWFTPQHKERNSVEIFIGCGGPSYIEAEQFLYSGIPAIITAQLLETARIRTRISIVLGSSPDTYTSKVFASIIPIKNYDEKIDINLLALLTSDPRFYRFEGLKGSLCIYDHFGEVLPSDFGNGLSRKYLSETIEKSDYLQTAKLAPNRFYFGRTFSESEAIEQINSVIKEMTEKIK